ncbi:type ISP restriction/modification enzyme [Cylindrospermopsis raciborskii]|uniref:Helicase ATP-binding domain-containing protein n=1 Tax=Cylindrospermopsis raciborskii CENA302 TaxID=1170768 RepID=A0A9Q5QUH9_9CYAN|nr:type ISP restriction/modification enzyme [Cylindrospermopsis raciborskii]NLQ04972.1 hypothetical protein [Cylindrospermopsis raciborskii MVCC19]OHY32985.1 hypothetical protein BCV64_11120 [Cylindrospermopsis raciborskii MVCC14]OPH08600.1 hypothetical protein CENA302_15265 [Cylindrospermopsis raciborskii CENA302]
MLNYLKTDPIYNEYFSQVWLWMDFPKRANMPDTGIDLVGMIRDTGDYCAIQCKCYDLNQTLQKSDIDSFFTASGTKVFKKRMIISTTAKWSKNAQAALDDQQIPVIRATIYDLENSPIDWNKYSLQNPDILQLKPKKHIRPHQQIALEKVLTQFEHADRGKLIMACGTGKTFTALKIAEHVPKHSHLILFLVPSISLLSQTLREWTAEMLPRIPYIKDFSSFSKAGAELAHYHLNYETIEPYEIKEFSAEVYLDNEDYQVEKMVFGKNKNGIDKTTIIYNSKIILSQIPLESYEYIVNGKSALEWIMERYKITKDKDSGIVNSPNHWSEDPRYIVDLIKRIVKVSMETVRIVKELPPLEV